MAGKTARVVIADDQVLYREGLRGLIDHWPDFAVVGEASNGREAVDLCRNTPTDLVLMDIQMPVMDGIEAARSIHLELPHVPIVMLTVAVDEPHIFGALQAGARGYMLKDTPARQLRNRLIDVLQGDATLSDEVTAKVIDELNRLRPTPVAAARAAQLTDREIDVLRLVAKGLSNDEIGAQLYLSVSTVKKYVAQLMQKLNLENRVQVAVYAVHAGLTVE